MATAVNMGSRRMRVAAMPETFGLWLIVALEIAVHVSLRYYFRRQHGG